ncbi:MAG: imidazole glycerol phosphate synthase subunit HisH [Steroidobacteraceae bacterium]
MIVANGGANVASLRFALGRISVEPEVSADPRVIRAATHVFLPGVGAARDAMRRLAAAGLCDVIPRLTQPVLGICLGMQLLYAWSEEQETACLGVFPGFVRRLERRPGIAVPHIGWNRLRTVRAHSLIDDIHPGEFAYFVHSFAIAHGPETIAVSEHGAEFAAVVSRENFQGVQFHPERSARAGARLLANFMGLNGWN